MPNTEIVWNEESKPVLEVIKTFLNAGCKTDSCFWKKQGCASDFCRLFALKK